MTVARAPVIFTTLAAFAGCSLFSDLGNLSEDPAAALEDSGGAADATAAGDTSADTNIAVVDAGPDASPYKQAVLADQPVAYWPFDEAPGANVGREVVGGKNADAVGAVTFGVNGADGTALERTANGGYLDVGDFFDLAGKQAYSIELWAWPKGSELFENVLVKRDGAQVGWIVYFRNENGSTAIQIEHRYAAGQRTTFVPVPQAKQRLHHIVFVYDPMDPTQTRSRVFIDSVRTNGFSDDGDADDIATPLTMVDSFVGILDEVAIYHHALTAERVAKHYELGAK